jgi:hypothetical protein
LPDILKRIIAHERERLGVTALRQTQLTQQVDARVGQ